MKIRFEIFAVEYNGLMDIVISCNGISHRPALRAGINQINLEVDSPSMLILTTSNKNMARDTKIDDNGNIIADKHLEIYSMTIEGLRIDKMLFNDLFFLPYLGYNRSNEIALPEKTDLVRWYLNHKERLHAAKR
jgi:hypothetical protein